jgi:hypothetical protein
MQRQMRSLPRRWVGGPMFDGGTSIYFLSAETIQFERLDTVVLVGKLSVNPAPI